MKGDHFDNIVICSFVSLDEAQLGSESNWSLHTSNLNLDLDLRRIMLHPQGRDIYIIKKRLMQVQAFVSEENNVPLLYRNEKNLILFLATGMKGFYTHMHIHIPALVLIGLCLFG